MYQLCAMMGSNGNRKVYTCQYKSHYKVSQNFRLNIKRLSILHQGRNIKRFREMLGIKQEAMAHELGEDWSRKKISLLEQKETVEEGILAQVSEILRIPVEAIQNLDEEQAVNIIANTFDNGSILNGINHYPTFHPIDRLIQLHEEKIALYERMLKEKDEMMARMERLLEGK